MSQNNSSQPVSASKSTAFVRLLGLQNDPFNVTSSAHYYYEDELLQETFSLVLDLLESPLRLVLVVGPPGSGISSFLNRLALHASSKYKVIHHTAANHLKPGLWRKSITQALETNTLATEKPLLLLDQGEEIESRMLSLVTQLSGNTSTPLPCVIGATADLLDQIETGECPLKIGHNTHLIRLRPFTLEQTTAYINQRLAAAGMRVPFTLTDVEIARIHKQANGLPARVNMFAQHALKDAKTLKQIRAVGRDFRTSEAQDTTPAPRAYATWSVLGGSVLFLLLASLTWYWFPNLHVPAATTLPNKGVPISVLPEPLPPTVSAIESRAPIKAPEVVKVPKLVLAPKPVKEHVRKSIPAPAPTNHPISAVAPIPPKQLVLENIPAPQSIKKSTSTEVIGATSEPKPPTKTKTRVRKPPPPSQAEVTEPTVALGALQTPQWLLKQSPAHFVLQLASAPQLDALERLARTHLLKPQGASYSVRLNNRPSYVLVVGTFATADEALQAISQLPDALRDPPPRVRSLKQMQKEIRRGTLKNPDMKNPDMENPERKPPPH